MRRFSAPAGAGKEVRPPSQRRRRRVEHQTVVGCTDSDILAGISKHRDDRFRLGRVDGFLEGFVLDIASFGNVGDLRQRAFDPLVAGGGFDHDVTVVVGHGVDGFMRRRRSAPHMDAPL